MIGNKAHTENNHQNEHVTLRLVKCLTTRYSRCRDFSFSELLQSSPVQKNQRNQHKDEECNRHTMDNFIGQDQLETVKRFTTYIFIALVRTPGHLKKKKQVDGPSGCQEEPSCYCNQAGKTNCLQGICFQRPNNFKVPTVRSKIKLSKSIYIQP